MFLTGGNNEYWSKPMYDCVQQARDAGIHLGFFGANAVYWQVRLEASPLSGIADRVVVCYKNSPDGHSPDPVQGPTTTILWRDPLRDRPEQQLMGVQFTGQIAFNAPKPLYVVKNSSSWVYAGTGLADGDSIPGIVGYETDSSMSSAPLPTSVAGTYQVLSQSPFTDSGGATVTANSSIYQAPSGAWVFGAGTTSWSWGLDLSGVVDPRIQRITANLLNRFLGVSSPAAPTVSITSPDSGANVGGTTSVTATASDDVGVAGVQFRVDGVNAGPEVTAPPYSTSWNTTNASNGPHTLTAVARDAAGLLTASAPVTVTVSNASPPTVTINQAAGQADPTNSLPINFTAVFSKPVSGFTGAGVTISGTAGGTTTVTVTGGPSTYTVAVSGMTSSGTVIASIPAVVAQDAAGNTNTASTSTDNSVAFGTFVSPTVLENQQPGSGNWQMWLHGIAPADDVNKQIKGYASATSVNKGESITFYVTVNPAQQYTMDVYRMGWYQGLGGRLMQSIGPLQGVAQPACPVDSVTGLIECNWTAAYTLTVPATWTSGVFMVQLTNAQGYQNYITFVVRDDACVADIMFQQAVATYQASNNYPDDGATGKSLYDFNSYGASTVAGTPRAVKCSWNRPYAGRG